MIRLREYDAGQSTEMPETPLKEWRDKFESSALTSAELMQYFQAASPFFFSIEDPTSFVDLGRCTFNEVGEKSAIIDSLEQFIFGDNPETVIEKIKAEQNRSVCLRVIKPGTPFYKCNECSINQVVVLCVSCFKQSAHRLHRYKIKTLLTGEAICDCGVIEAWKRDSNCDEHKGNVENLQSTVITERMRERCYIVYDAVLTYCMRSLNIGSLSSLEGQDGDLKEDDTFCTVVYNNKTHTFEQVIQTLTRIVGCMQKDAIDYVSNIDREGRAVVKCASFQECIKLKGEIEKNTMRGTIPAKPTSLKVAVLHKNAVAYQQLSLYLLGWFQEFVSRSPVFRAIFAQMMTPMTDSSSNLLSNQNNSYSLHEILLNDCKLWKTARTAWHRLLIAGMLMEHEDRKTLAIVFTQQYTRIMQDYIHADYEQTSSILSLSTELFTVPSIAQHLIAHENAIFVLMQSFFSETIEETIPINRNTNNYVVRERATCALHTLKIVLSFKPDVWTDELRRNFLHGVQILIRVLKGMQGMHAVFQAAGRHMEYDFKWQWAFNLIIKLVPIISLVLDWCSSDCVVFIEAYRMVMSNLNGTEFIVSQTSTEVKELADHSALCQMYDASTKQVSIHLPLSRFFAGLYLLLEKFELTFDTFPLPMPKLIPEQIIEPVLCTMTMIAHFHHDPRRPGGASLLSQWYYYRNVECRAEMLDRDVVVLQIGASLIESNEFLIHLHNKFDLINWATADYETTTLTQPEEDGLAQVINMVDEMLELIIVIVGERHVPGIGMVSEEDKIRKEIIQALCIKPYSHLELGRTLPDVQNDDFIKDVIDSVATFEQPTQSDKIGVYELKPHHYDDYNMYFYHYTKEEKSKSEEEQRKRRIAKNQLVCCPPPKLPQLTPLFSKLANLLQCDVMLLLMQTILKRANDLKARSFSDSHLQKVLHLIGYAVQEQASGAYPFFTFYDRAAQWDLLPLMEELVSSARVEAHRDLILWTVRKYKELQPRNPGEQAMECEDVSEAKQGQSSSASCSCSCRCVSVCKMMTDIKLAEKKDSAQSAIDRQLDNASKSSICLGRNRKYRFVEDPVVTCILCSKDAVVNAIGPCMVYSAFVRKSNKLPHHHDLSLSPHTSTCGHAMHEMCWKRYFNIEVMNNNRRSKWNPFQDIFDTDKHEFLCPLCRCSSNAVLPIPPALSRVGAQHPIQCAVVAGEDAALLTATAMKAEPTEITQLEEFDAWLAAMRVYNEALQQIEDLPNVDASTSNILDKFMNLDTIHPDILAQSVKRDILSSNLREYCLEFAKCAKLAAPYPSVEELTEPYFTTWVSCAYTIETLEMYLRALDKPLKGQMSIRQTSCLSGLIRVSGLLVAAIDDLTAAKILIHLRSQLSMIFTNSASCFIDWDLFKVYVLFMFTTPAVLLAKIQQCIIPNGTLLEFYLLQMIYAVVITKIVVLHKYDSAANPEPSADDSMSGAGGPAMETSFVESSGGDHGTSQRSALVDFYSKYNIQVKNAREASGGTPTFGKSEAEIHEMLMQAIREESRVFLRSTSLLFHFLTDIDMPDEMYDADGDTFEVMCNFLGLSCDIDAYLRCDNIKSFMENLANHPEIDKLRTNKVHESQSAFVVPRTPKVRRLIGLPVDYNDLIIAVSTFTCPNNKRYVSRYPTMCLVCGSIMCSMSYCCQREHELTTVGSCTYHAQKCGTGFGIFLRIRECEILLLGLNQGRLMPAPYLDEYGETDQGLRRGNPLTLCQDRYQKLNSMWLSHTLHEEIARVRSTSTTTYVRRKLIWKNA